MRKLVLKVDARCVAVCCSVLQCIAVCCNVLQCAAEHAQASAQGGCQVCCCVLRCVAVCCGVLRCVAVCCRACANWFLRRMTGTIVRGSVLQHVAMCCSVLQGMRNLALKVDASGIAMSCSELH